jgi:hypothetical protein
LSQRADIEPTADLAGENLFSRFSVAGKQLVERINADLRPEFHRIPVKLLDGDCLDASEVNKIRKSTE